MLKEFHFMIKTTAKKEPDAEIYCHHQKKLIMLIFYTVRQTMLPILHGTTNYASGRANNYAIFG